tara:strand:- start:327 stop:560 length:234 start_codon:yes stop_codon:yes gene_type:complete
MSDWISIEDALPQLFVSVMVFPYHDFNYSDKLTAELQLGGKWVVNCEDSYQQCEQELNNVTHWMPLPEPPVIDKERS